VWVYRYTQLALLFNVHTFTFLTILPFSLGIEPMTKALLFEPQESYSHSSCVWVDQRIRITLKRIAGGAKLNPNCSHRRVSPERQTKSTHSIPQFIVTSWDRVVVWQIILQIVMGVGVMQFTYFYWKFNSLMYLLHKHLLVTSTWLCYVIYA